MFDIRIGIVLLLVAPSACSTRGSGSPFTGTTKALIVIEVDNQGFNQSTVWILSSSGERRLGTINGKVQRSFTVRWPRSDDLR